MAPRLKKPTKPRQPWWGDDREFRIRMYEHGLAGCTLPEAADLEGVPPGRLIELCREKRSFYRAFKKGKSALSKKTRSAIAEIALESEVRDQDRINALKLLSQVLKLDKVEDVDLDNENGLSSTASWAELAVRAETIEEELDSGARKSDPITGSTPRSRRNARPHQIIES